MAVFIALLRAVNVGGTGKLPMATLKELCAAEGFKNAKTYIASGNVVFETTKSPVKIKTGLEKRLEKYAGKPVGVIVRSASEMDAILKDNPFPKAAPNRTLALFLDQPPKPDAIKNLKGQKNEELRLGAREIYVHYGEGMATSKLVIPAAKSGTMRNMNTVAKLVEMAAALEAVA